MTRLRKKQDRLVKAMRVFNVTTKEEADIYLATKFIPRYNEQFSKPPLSKVNAHRPKDGFDLDAIFSVQEERVVANDNTFRYRGKKYQIDLLPTDLDLKRRKVTVETRLNGRMAIRLEKTYYKFHEIL
ncbi:MAG: hypothetical protein LBI10_06600 [Deltaproteobacteria bacterium]|nr:hypothetical protein [Deltaproteobacteria bacterium]